MTLSPLNASLGLVLVLAVSGCTVAPGPRPVPLARPIPAPVAAAPMAQPSNAAEAACISAGQERGLQVLGVAGSRDVVTATGEMQRDVMLRVSRGGAQIELRCSYQTTTGLARIMLI